ncbi:uncharacterized protein LOC115626491 [Scaptodrosophila lebanonensis]|uniref:Uncharacterized protein LOC115626491 n=1 Tax=Drosophila lebanonensis TaxID=7225 RepID=A0A6J2TQE3_DROLE|nr:uncharacterized protein LOC115626491 [Scaptodrosophila lebanonensis]
MSKEAAKPKKPLPNYKFPMHDTHLKKTLGNVRVACVLALIAPLLLYVFHNGPRKTKYKNFYSTYDPMTSFNRMQKGGYLTSCPGGGGGGDKKKDDKKKDEKKDDKKDDKKKK